MNAETITTRIYAKADAELKAKIEAAIGVFKTTLRDAGVSTYDMRPQIHRNFLRSTDTKELPYATMPELLAMEFDQLFRFMPEAAFAVAYAKNRTAAIDAYMRRIEELGARCDQLEQEINEVRQ